MSDLIRRQDALDALGEKPLAWTEGEYELGLQNQWQSDVDALKDLPSAEPERKSMVWKPAKGRPAYEKGICNCGYVLSVLQRDFVYCPKCGAKLDWGE